MGAEVPASRRIGSRKSRSGCKTCKIRRVKCGEEKPTCHRCSSTGRRCEYEGSPIGSTTPPDLVLSQALSLSPNSGRRERRAFEYYFQHVAKYLAGGMAIDFWTGVIPQLCRTEPAVWDSMIAISSLFEHPEQCTDFTLLRARETSYNRLDSSQRDALTWYSRSISNIHSQIERGKADPYIALISCVLFICIETIQGRMEEALQLYKQGMSLIRDLRSQVSFGKVSATRIALLEHTMIPLFLRLGTISLTISEVQPTEIFALVGQETIASSFQSISSARSAIVVLSMEIILFEREAGTHLDAVGGEAFVSQHMLARKQSLQTKLDAWVHAYNSYCQRVSAKFYPLGVEPLLLSYHAAASIFLSGCLTLSETVFDAHIAHFAIIVEQADLALSASAGPDGSQPPFTFEMGVGIPLFLTSMKCREPSLRQRALHLLLQAPPMQGFFKCTPVALLAGNLMKLEEHYASTMREKTPEQHFSDDTHNPVSMKTPLELIPEEARVSFRGVFRPANGFPPNIKEFDVARWGRGPDQLFLHYSRQIFDANSKTWQQVSDIVPLEG
ncbi:C6 finger domain protein [Penicillium brasilianum]|uniref:C6 finger domain protein n=1 Tax=Penicillium brasilianum TaxID=104259 RepID=A0A1S9RQV5_PENBI|nr:C6 finger domain protein [Penicillium brasilianum]